LLFLERYPRDNPIKKFFTARRERTLRLQEAIDSILASDVIGASMEIAGGYVQRANAAIDFLPNSDAKDCLLELGEYVLTRRS
jgi:geranylgeranyl pyrophosphate synthase